MNMNMCKCYEACCMQFLSFVHVCAKLIFAWCVCACVIYLSFNGSFSMNRSRRPFHSMSFFPVLSVNKICFFFYPSVSSFVCSFARSCSESIHFSKWCFFFTFSRMCMYLHSENQSNAEAVAIPTSFSVWRKCV